MTGVGHYGYLPPTLDGRDFYAAPRAPYRGPYVDLSGGFPQQPYDQEQLGSCVANGVAALVDYVRARQGLPPLAPPSRLFIYWWARKLAGYPTGQDTGLQIRDGLKEAAKVGAPPEGDWPYDITRFADRPPGTAYEDAQADQALVYGQIAQTDVDATIAAGHPLAFGFQVYDSFESPAVAATGVMPVPAAGEGKVGRHCVVACSTLISGTQLLALYPGCGAVVGVNYRLCRNSWGHDGTWGLPSKPGYFFMPTAVMDGPYAGDFWQITTMKDPGKPVPPAPADPFDPVIAALRKAWRALDAWLKRHGL